MTYSWMRPLVSWMTMNAPRLSMMRPATLTLICCASSASLPASAYCFCRSPAWLSRRKSLGKGIAWLSRRAASFSLRWAISLFSSSWRACSFSGCSLMVVVSVTDSFPLPVGERVRERGGAGADASPLTPALSPAGERE
ncbi:hypothetical protein D3C81_1913300 [compost metagenome]